MERKFWRSKFHGDLFPEWLVPDVTKFPKGTPENTTVHVEDGREGLTTEKETADEPS